MVKKLIKNTQRFKHCNRSNCFEIKAIDNYNKHLKVSRVKVDFSPIQSAFDLNPNILPVFNLDYRFWTKAFVLGFRLDYYRSNPSREWDKFSEKRKQKVQAAGLDSKSVTEFSRFSAAHKYCQVCKQRYSEDYVFHVSAKKHVEVQGQSKANQYIEQLILKYRRKSVHKPCHRNSARTHNSTLKSDHQQS